MTKRFVGQTPFSEVVGPLIGLESGVGVFANNAVNASGIMPGSAQGQLDLLEDRDVDIGFTKNPTPKR